MKTEFVLAAVNAIDIFNSSSKSFLHIPCAVSGQHGNPYK